MSERPYRKAVVANLFFRKIKALVVDSVFISADLISTIAVYFNFNTSPAEDEAAAAAETIRDAVFHVGNLTGLGFQNFNSRPNRSYEENYHSFVGERACGRWVIAHLKRYLWGTRLYWMCDCTTVK